MITPTQLLMQRWGDPAHPAEWDGRDGNGGIGSQRFWEYLWVLQQIGTPKWVLDVGGGAGFFADLVADSGAETLIVDPLLPEGRKGSRCALEDFSFSLYDEGASVWLTCISVLEHVTDKAAFCAALDDSTIPIALTFEFGPGGVEQKELYRCLAAFKRHHITKMERCPIHADNSSWDRWVPMGVVLQPNL